MHTKNKWDTLCCLSPTDRESIYIKYKNVHCDRPDIYYAIDDTEYIETQLRSLRAIEEFNAYCFDPE